MVDEQMISGKISSIRETLTKLSKSIKSSEPSALDAPFESFQEQTFKVRTLSQEREILQQELGDTLERASYKDEESDRQQFTLDDYIQPRSESPLHSFRAPVEGNKTTFADLRLTVNRDSLDSEGATRDKRDQIDTLLERINEKDRTIREQGKDFSMLQEKFEAIREALKQAKSTSEKQLSEMQQDLEREKRLRSQAETQLREAVLDAEEAKIQLKLKTNQGSSDKAWKTEFAALQAKLDDTNKLKITLLGENAELHKTVQGKELEILKLREDLRVAAARQREEMARDEGPLMELRATQKDIARLKRENEELRQKEARIAQLERENQSLEREVAALRVSQLDSPRSPTEQEDLLQRLALLEQQLAKAMSENDNLYLELSSRPTHKQVKEKERLIEELHAQVAELSRNRRLRGVRSVSPKDSGRTTGRRERSESDSETEETMVEDLLRALHAASLGEAIRKVEKLRKRNSASQKLVERLSSLVQECSPQGAYSRSPSHKDIWKWTRRIAEEYMSIRQSHDVQKVNSDIVSEVLELLGLVYPSEVPKHLAKLLDEAKFQRSLLDKVKLHLNLSPRTSLQELEQHLTSTSQ